jgi:hypothetical protein
MDASLGAKTGAMGLPFATAWSLLSAAARITRDIHRKVNEPVNSDIRCGVFVEYAKETG